MTAPGFCRCKALNPDTPRFHPPEGATWHYLCDKPVLAGAMAQFDAERKRIEALHAARVPSDDPPEFAPDDGEAQRIAEVYADARAEQDRGL